MSRGLDIASQVPDALTEAHGPASSTATSRTLTIVTSRGLAKVLDFGLASSSARPRQGARRSTGSRTRWSWCWGPSPHGARAGAGPPARGRFDRFSLGVCSTRCRRRLPFQGQTFCRSSTHPGSGVAGGCPLQLRGNARHGRGPPAGAREVAREALPVPARFYIDLRSACIALEEEAHRCGGRGVGSRPAADAQPPLDRVITFANITREPVDEWIGSGIAETVSADLKNVPGITVIGRSACSTRCATSDGRAPASTTGRDRVGRGLGARWIVAGAFQRFGAEIRITARFVEVDTGAVLRNVKIDGALERSSRLQDRIVFELTQAWT